MIISIDAEKAFHKIWYFSWEKNTGRQMNRKEFLKIPQLISIVNGAGLKVFHPKIWGRISMFALTISVQHCSRYSSKGK